MKREKEKIIAIILMLAYCGLLNFLECAFLKPVWQIAIITYFMYLLLAIPAIRRNTRYLKYCNYENKNNKNIEQTYWRLQGNIFLLNAICFTSIGIGRLLIYKNVFLVFLIVGIFFFVLCWRCFKL